MNRIIAVLTAIMMIAGCMGFIQSESAYAETSAVEITGATVYFDTGTGTVTGVASLTSDSIEIPGEINGVTVKRIGSGAFLGRKTLVSVVLPDSIEVIESSAFNNCKNLKSVNIPKDVISIESFAFSHCTSLETIDLPEGLKSIDSGAFEKCDSLTEITIPATVDSIVKMAFSNCYSLENIYVAAGNAAYYDIDGVLFDSDSLHSYPAGKQDKVYRIPEQENIKYINNNAFEGAKYLETVYIPGNVVSVMKYGFYNCTLLKNIYFSEGLTHLQEYAFSNCAIEEVVLPESLEKLCTSAFSKCGNLKSLNIPAGVSSIYFRNSTFTNCTSLEAINVDPANEYYTSVEGVLFNKDMTELIRYPQNRPGNVYHIPEGVKTLAQTSFYGCTLLEEVTFPVSMTSIESSAFWDCTSLRSVVLNEGLSSINGSAFACCAGLKTIKIPDSVTELPGNMFEGIRHDVVIICGEGSAAEQYAIDNNIPYSHDGETIAGTGAAVDKAEPVVPADRLQQIIAGTESYKYTYGKTGSFNLDASAYTDLSYSSSNSKVATVDDTGKVSIKGAGTAVITVTAAADSRYLETVKKISITVAKASQTITGKSSFSKTFVPGGTFALNAGSKTARTYKSSNTKVATVSAAGKVTMKNPGTATITVTAKSTTNYNSATKKVKVTSKLKKPTLTAKALSGKKVKLTWNKVPGASGYKIYVYDNSKKKYVCRLTKSANVKSVTHKGLKAGKTYKYKVRAYRTVNGKKVYSSYSDIKKVKARK